MNPQEMMTLAKYLARKHIGPAGKYSPYVDDMAQEALLGILDAHAKFDPARNCALKTLCVTWGSQRIVRFLERNVYPLLACVSELIDGDGDAVRISEELEDTSPRHDRKAEARIDVERFLSVELEARIAARFRKAHREKARQVALSRLAGNTLHEIGGALGFSREAARQYLSKMRLDTIDTNEI